MNSLTKPDVFNVEAVMYEFPQLELLTKHHFSKGVYARELHIPKDTMLTGHIHKYQNLNILVKGRMKVLVNHEIKEVEAPFIVVSPPGTKRIAYAIDDCVWITIHGTDETDLDIIEQKFIARTEKEYLEFVGKDQLVLPGFKDD